MSADDVMAFTVQALQEMNYYTDDTGPDSLLGPAGVDLDSLAVSELAMRIEDEYGVTFDDDDIETLAIMTLGEFAAEVAKRAALVAQADGVRG
ncbi:MULTISPECIES: acyl carrier protein [Micromonospora]|uniref:Acyl carrier protein n=1 Tax=Micromonospora rifamycinica TaxID=291594 RepID=A0A109IN81_9ACTN|nr:MULTISPECIES: acyl carrier protein [Micromonospora]KWV33642.1 phosphopantetheine-binding-protein [Micromonospora rifamycinica]WFE65233.1 acyl carrier protein [Micromonospora sp. WMMD714]SCG46920.1 acyl carrier protein [Micromonospora rifamycinica]